MSGRCLEKTDWIAAETWTLFGRRDDIWANRESMRDAGSQLNRINLSIRRHLKIDRKNRILNVGNLIEDSLTKGHDRDAWHTIRKWYTQSTGGNHTGTPTDIEQQTQIYQKLYSTEACNLPEQSLEPPQHPYNIEDDIPQEHDIARIVR